MRRLAFFRNSTWANDSQSTLISSRDDAEAEAQVEAEAEAEAKA
jgi:hypothetical protein